MPKREVIRKNDLHWQTDAKNEHETNWTQADHFLSII